MDFSKKLKKGKYTSPSGKESVFLWGSLSRETDLKTGLFTFPDKDGAEVQHQGAGATSFPLTCIFNGQTCMERADAFEKMLFEKGVGELQHPIYGTHKVVPHGKVKRVDDMLSGVGDAVVEVTFVKVISDNLVPKLEKVEVDEINEKYDKFTDVACEDFSKGIAVDSVDEKLNLKADLKESIESIKNTLANFSGGMNQNLNDCKQSIKEMFNKGDSVFIASYTVSKSILNTFSYLSQIDCSISEKVKAYSFLIAKIISQFRNDPVGVNNVTNSIMTTRLVLGGAISALATGVAVQSVCENEFDVNKGVLTREESLNAGLEILNLYETIKDFDDSKIASNSFVDKNSEFYFQLQDLIYECVLVIFNSSFVLPIRRTIVLDRDRQLLELCAELYGSLDFVDSLIFENKLKADEIVLLPMGKEISYYVESA